MFSVCVDMSGQIFGRLTVIRRNGTRGSGALWLCRCECGNEVTVARSELKRGQSKSCGCLRSERLRVRAIARNTKHSQCRRRNSTGAWNSWRAAIRRCGEADNIHSKYYRDRGVRVCERWMNFSNFFEDMGPRPEGATLGRYLDSGNYEPGNCQWMTWAEQTEERKKKNHATIKSWVNFLQAPVYKETYKPAD